MVGRVLASGDEAQSYTSEPVDGYTEGMVDPVQAFWNQKI
jgi:hypothetical protein